MARREREGRGGPGGIVALAGLAEDHAGALDYDLMTLTRWTLDDLGGELGWERLLHFVQNLPPTSALARAMHPDMAEEHKEGVIAAFNGAHHFESDDDGAGE